MAKKLYLVKQTFKAGGKLFEAGSLIEDLSEIKLFKIRLNEGKLIPLPSEGKELDNLDHFFRERYGLDLKTKIKARASKGSNVAEPVVQKAIATPTTGTPKRPAPVSGKKVVTPTTSKG